jgi:hypothetical protein
MTKMVLLSDGEAIVFVPVCSKQKTREREKASSKKKKSKTPNAEKASASLAARSHRYSRAATQGLRAVLPWLVGCSLKMAMIH